MAIRASFFIENNVPNADKTKKSILKEAFCFQNKEKIEKVYFLLHIYEYIVVNSCEKLDSRAVLLL